MKFGILFSGQGAQTAGMGLDFLADPLFKETTDQASQACGLDLPAIWQNRQGELDETRYVQPALVAFEYGVWRLLERDTDLPICGMAGLSLGEYGALLASGYLSWPSGLELVKDRGEYMQLDSEKVASGMLALVKPKLPELEEFLRQKQEAGSRVYLANYNSPKQVVLAGVQAELPEISQEITSLQLAKRAISLPVAGAFHTPLYQEASRKMHERLQGEPFASGKHPVISNTTKQAFSQEKLAEILEVQLMQPTHFAACVQELLNRGMTASLEIGPGHALSSFAKQTDRKLQGWQIGSLEEYQQFVEDYQNGFEE
ncbi:malonyl CoA-acyl carrier protein transacylase [Lactobacillus nasalidis]|uniref:Malonyl CoA-acyl carrier protein transacylase n=1 Tax=Lactobacillus nasalidis TaxID=2797258 RepID=A0ABQ3W313_9LACO|nr:ACP S-malonyltransferase [Lactobacillus nasalidis]GHV97918.1 malonyl CoA-acyl carrier protein transacylase [Lactobacillus nasalidis]GHV99059.1 malonyl CoA-acyl carrier protein transacylase [Lactobacillus nasalidis]GHW00566.1 malonyl CoA-acyl carrier protein transacylase [Lactobacillus nasalidis]